MMRPCFCAVPAPTMIGLWISKGISLLCHFNIRIKSPVNLTSPFLTLLMPPASAASWGTKSQAVTTHCVLLSCFKLTSYKFYWVPPNLALQGLVNISADSAYPHPSWFYKLQSSLPVHMATPSTDHFTCPICMYPFMCIHHVEDRRHEQHLTKKLSARMIIQNWVKYIQYFS